MGLTWARMVEIIREGYTYNPSRRIWAAQDTEADSAVLVSGVPLFSFSDLQLYDIYRGLKEEEA